MITIITITIQEMNSAKVDNKELSDLNSQLLSLDSLCKQVLYYIYNYIFIVPI